jgi:TonB-like protein
MRAILIIGVVLAAGAGLGAQDPLGAAKDLYASAAYEDALSQLSRLDGGTAAPEIARQADEYRVFCLYALGRTEEAESLAEVMIRKAPLARLGSADASPRLELMFSDIRRRLMPSLIRERFRTAKSALDQKSFTVAGPPLTEARLMIVEAEKLGVRDDGLADLSALVDGFLLLIRSAAEQQAPAPAPVAAAPATVTPRPQAPETASRQVPTPPPATASRAASAAPAPAAGRSRVYSIDDEGVSPPVALDQRMPALSADLGALIKRRRVNGQVDVLIDEAGRVVEATIRQPVNSTFDALILQSARGWKYRPATKDGVPVRYLKTLLLVP